MSAYLASELRLAQTMVEANGIVAFYEPYAECRRDKIFGSALHSFDNIPAVDDRLYVLSDGGIRS